MSARIIMKLQVSEVSQDASGIKIIRFVHPHRPTLPAAPAGAHVDVHIPGGKIRQYSLCGDPRQTSHYTIAVKRSDTGRGGSRWLHEHAEPGLVLPVSAPRSNFPLAAEASRHIFVAGGIGITPFVSLAWQARAQGQDFLLHYCARQRTAAPLLGTLQGLCGADGLATWFSGDPGGCRFDASTLGDPIAGTHVYCCGPASLIAAVREATAHWPESQVHFEVFEATLDENFKPEPFDIRIASTGATLRVPADQSALDVLRRQGHALPSSCEMGVCGACVCGYTDGTVLHRDAFLSASQRQEKMALCVSRARVGVTLEL
ncbi:Oxidoreductase [Bordetella sputigena]|uniref:PDR/VanB family oxidoreductase n=1 Tax=Bordetella sputigena TaxID=1416810 RepID=UPI0039F09D4E